MKTSDILADDPSYQAAEILLAKRNAARKDYYFFARYMLLARRGYKWQRAPHHQIICDALMRVYRGECKRLIINIPPRYSKTELAVISFMAWCLGMHPDCEFIHTSYSSRLASSNAWQARELVSSVEYQELFPETKLNTDSQARDEWRTTTGGCVYAVGAEGTITGYGAGKAREGFGGCILIDDIHKPEEIRSETTRKNTIEWFPRTLESRKNSAHTPIIVIGQCLHEEDLSGWLRAGGNGEQWESLILPAIQNDGSALWPEKHTIEDLKRMQNASPYTFASQYMQSPTPMEGGVFKPDSLIFCDDISKVTNWVRAWDLAATQDDGDWTVGALIGKTPERGYVIADIQRLQGSPDKVEQAICRTAVVDGKSVKISLPKDPGQAGNAQVVYLTKALAGYPVSNSPESGDKVTRAEPFAAQVNVGLVSIVRAEWNFPLIHEMRNFPFGKFDDQVDACSRGFNFLVEKKPAMFISDTMIQQARMPMSGFKPRARL